MKKARRGMIYHPLYIFGAIGIVMMIIDMASDIIKRR